MPDLTPAPGSTATSAPSATIRFTVSGVAETRNSPPSLSAQTAIFTGFSEGENGRCAHFAMRDSVLAEPSEEGCS
jgi:hypothetical protein